MRFDLFREFLEREGVVVFTLQDAVRAIGSPAGYARLFLSRLAHSGKIVRIQRGKYCLKGVGELEVASNLAYPSYVSFLSALAFHKLTTQVPVVVQIACARQKKSIKFGNVRIEFIKLKKDAFFGFRRFGGVFAADPEKAVIDGLYLPEKLPLSEAFYALRQGLDTEKLCEYAGRFGSPIVKRRLGFLLEKTGVKNAPLKAEKTTRYSPLNPLLKAKGEKNKKWMLIVNEVLE